MSRVLLSNLTKRQVSRATCLDATASRNLTGATTSRTASARSRVAYLSTSARSQQAEVITQNPTHTPSSWSAEKAAAFSTSSLSSSPSPSPSTSISNASSSFLSTKFPNLPSPFPAPVANRILTHMSYTSAAKGMDGHNSRLAFLGRRVLKAYYLMWLSANGAELQALNGLEEVDLEEVAERALDTRILGEKVAKAWGLERGVRWTSAIPPSEHFASSSLESSYRRGKEKVMGTAVEAVIGGIFHQYGGAESYNIFQSHVLPHLDASSARIQSETTEQHEYTEAAPPRRRAVA